MRLLLDTHTVLWFAMGDTALSAKARAHALDPASEVLVSHVTAWELAIKTGLGKLKLDRELPRWLERNVSGNGFSYLPIALAHTLAVARLPHHHGDPFDRLLIAQCEIERLTLVSRDPSFDAYGIKRVW
ncbi:MAG: type II toxin-antitoxin system VapC family toxin [Verrucomicrobia bacterium]|nr:type II toxin-antitoxin system VapC family toxin [Verrucomicrobiota bacterium]